MACSAVRENRAGASGGEVAAARSGVSDTSRSAILDRALGDFERAVLERDTARFMQLLDAHYRQVEFEGFYRGVVPQFLNEFFCGKTPKGDQLFCLPFDGISELKRADLSGSEVLAMVEYAVKTPDSEIRARLQVNLEKDGKVKGFIGSNGYTQVE